MLNSKNKVTTASREIFGEWDDLMEWEAYYTAFAQWQGRYQELAQCLER